MGQDPIEAEVLSPEEAARLHQAEHPVVRQLADLSFPQRLVVYLIAFVTATGILVAGVVHLLRERKKAE